MQLCESYLSKEDMQNDSGFYLCQTLNIIYISQFNHFVHGAAKIRGKEGVVAIAY